MAAAAIINDQLSVLITRRAITVTFRKSPIGRDGIAAATSDRGNLAVENPRGQCRTSGLAVHGELGALVAKFGLRAPAVD